MEPADMTDLKGWLLLLLGPLSGTLQQALFPQMVDAINAFLSLFKRAWDPAPFGKRALAFVLAIVGPTVLYVVVGYWWLAYWEYEREKHILYILAAFGVSQLLHMLKMNRTPEVTAPVGYAEAMAEFDEGPPAPAINAPYSPMNPPGPASTMMLSHGTQVGTPPAPLPFASAAAMPTFATRPPMQDDGDDFDPKVAPRGGVAVSGRNGELYLGDLTDEELMALEPAEIERRVQGIIDADREAVDQVKVERGPGGRFAKKSKLSGAIGNTLAPNPEPKTLTPRTPKAKRPKRES